MHKLQRTAGKSFETLKIGGKSYTLRPIKLGIYAEMEAFVISQRVDPIAALGERIEAVPEAYRKDAWDAVIRQVMSSRNATAQEIADFERSIKGLAWKLWQCLKADHPEIESVDQVVELLEQAGKERMEEIMLKTRIASGEADMEKFSGQAGPQTNPDPAGQQSTETCSSTTA